MKAAMDGSIELEDVRALLSKVSALTNETEQRILASRSTRLEVGFIPETRHARSLGGYGLGLRRRCMKNTWCPADCLGRRRPWSATWDAAECVEACEEGACPRGVAGVEEKHDKGHRPWLDFYAYVPRCGRASKRYLND
jgi:hypothetical protein